MWRGQHRHLNWTCESTAIIINHCILEIVNIVLIFFWHENGNIKPALSGLHIVLSVIEYDIVNHVTIEVANKGL
jgi:hypothetical protein